jgi:hypothetical protein
MCLTHAKLVVGLANTLAKWQEISAVLFIKNKRLIFTYASVYSGLKTLHHE